VLTRATAAIKFSVPCHTWLLSCDFVPIRWSVGCKHELLLFLTGNLAASENVFPEGVFTTPAWSGFCPGLRRPMTPSEAYKSYQKILGLGNVARYDAWICGDVTPRNLSGHGHTGKSRVHIWGVTRSFLDCRGRGPAGMTAARRRQTPVPP
jgi:hypothetical protein